MKDSLPPSLLALLLRMKKTFLMLFALLLPVAADPLEPYLWKNRILLISSSEPLNELNKQKEELTDRNLVILRLSASKTTLPNEVSLTSKERKELRERYKVTEKGPATFILIGKDGGEKARQTKEAQSRKILRPHRHHADAQS